MAPRFTMSFILDHADQVVADFWNRNTVESDPDLICKEFGLRLKQIDQPAPGYNSIRFGRIGSEAMDVVFLVCFSLVAEFHQRLQSAPGKHGAVLELVI